MGVQGDFKYPFSTAFRTMSKRVARSVWIPAPSGYSLSLKEYSDEFSLLTQRPKMLINCAGVTCEDLIPERYQEQRRLRIRSLVDMTISEFEMVEVWVVLGEEVPAYSQFRLHVSPCSMLIEVKSVPVPRFEPGTEFVAQNIKLTRADASVAPVQSNRTSAEFSPGAVMDRELESLTELPSAVMDRELESLGELPSAQITEQESGSPTRADSVDSMANSISSFPELVWEDFDNGQLKLVV